MRTRDFAIGMDVGSDAASFVLTTRLPSGALHVKVVAASREDEPGDYAWIARAAGRQVARRNAGLN